MKLNNNNQNKLMSSEQFLSNDNDSKSLSHPFDSHSDKDNIDVYKFPSEVTDSTQKQYEFKFPPRKDHKLSSPTNPHDEKLHKSHSEASKFLYYKSDDFMTLIFLGVDMLAKVLFTFMVLVIVFKILPNQLRHLYCSKNELSKYTGDSESNLICNSDIIVATTNALEYFLSTCLSILMLTDNFPHSSMIHGQSTTNNQSCLISKIGLLMGVNGNLFAFLLRMFYLINIMADSSFYILFPFGRDFFKYLAFALFNYYAVIPISNMFFATIKANFLVIRIPTFMSSENKLNDRADANKDKGKNDYFELKKMWKFVYVLPAILCLSLGISIICIPSYGYGENQIPPLSIVLPTIILFLLVFMNVYLITLKIKEKNGIFYIIILVTFYQINKSLHSLNLLVVIILLVLNIVCFVVLLVVQYVVFYRKKAKVHNFMSILYILKESDRLAMIIMQSSAAFLFGVGTVFFCSEQIKSITDYSNFNADNLTQFVHWCVENIDQKYKDLLYNMNFTDNTTTMNALFVLINVPIITIITGYNNFFLANRRLDADRSYLLVIPIILMSYLIPAGLYKSLTENLLLRVWVWTDVSETTFDFKTAETFMKLSNISLTASVLLICVYFTAEYGENVQAVVEASAKIETSTIKADKRIPQVIIRLLSLLISLFLIILFFSSGFFDNANEWVSVKADPLNSTLDTFEFKSFEMSQNMCDVSAGGKMKNLVDDLSSDLNSLSISTKSLVPDMETVLFQESSPRFQFLGIPFFTSVAIFLFNIGSIMSKTVRQSEKGFILICLIFILPAVIYSALVFAILYFFALNLVFPFYVISSGENFTMAINYNFAVFVLCVIKLYEIYFYPFQYKDSVTMKSQDSNDDNNESGTAYY